MVVGRLTKAVIELVFPARCVGCGSNGEFLCGECADSMPVAGGARCSRCWRPVAGCLSCETAPPPFDSLRSAFVDRGVVPDLVRALKYRGATALAEPMAEWLASTVGSYGMDADVIVPVPLSGLRRRTRGYNQAEELARALGRRLDMAIWPSALERRRDTPPQARSADAEERRRNVAGAFHANDPDIAGRRLLLVDDVTTTGATLAACATALKSAGARSVRALTFARED